MRKVFLCTAAGALALAVACGKSSEAPTSPSTSVTAGDTSAAADGSTLKATAPAPVSPINGAQPDSSLVLIATKSQGKFTDAALSYQFQIRSGSTVVFDSGIVGGIGNGPTQVQFTPNVALTPDATFTWRARAAFGASVGPWSSDATFKSPVGGFIRGNELFDPLVGGRTVGQIVGPATFTNEGLKLLAHESHVTYQLPATLTSGEFGMMIKGADEGSEGDKSKVFSMQQGFDDLTTNAYRFTAELRGANYPQPGSISCRMIAGDAVSRDCDRVQIGFDSSRWYFWRVTWNQGGNFTMQVRLDSENGPVIYSNSQALNGRTYRPTPHILYLGAPLGRAGALDATLPNGTYKNVYAGPGPRPTFPQ